MKALTICQPYAHLIVTGEKRVENRTWTTSYRGPLLIHAGKSREWLSADDPEGMAFGALVGQVTLADCLTVGSIDAGVHEERYPRLRYHHHVGGPWCWVLVDVQRFGEPIPYRGAQGLFDVDWPPENPVHA